MKKRNYIPRRQTMPVIRKPRVGHKVAYTEEKKPLGEVCAEHGIDIRRIAKLVNLTFLLSDVIEGLVFDVENELKKSDTTLGLELRHPVSRIKTHTKEMIRFVDTTLQNEETSYDFATKSDAIREMVEGCFK